MKPERSFEEYRGAFRAGVLALSLWMFSSFTTAHAETTLRLLQMNLCNSGLAGCYQCGKATAEAYSKITAQRPDVVTLNEICSGDVQQLWLAMQAVWPGQVGDESRGKTLAFKPAFNASTGQNYKCANGQEFGNGILWHSNDPTGPKASGIYANQDTGAEKRSWQCVQIMPNGPYACTTHLSAASEPVALAQCRELMSFVAAGTGNGALPAVIGGDFNLEYDTSDPENVQLCVPSGYYRKGDGDVQHWIVSNKLTFVSRTSIGMSYTDHPAFLLIAKMP